MWSSSQHLLPRTHTGQAALVVALYAALALVVFYAPIDPHAALVAVFGSRAQAREALTAFVQLLFWPIVVLVTLTAGREAIAGLLRRD
jgi:hypothetical protein